MILLISNNEEKCPRGRATGVFCKYMGKSNAAIVLEPTYAGGLVWVGLCFCKLTISLRGIKGGGGFFCSLILPYLKQSYK